MITNLFQVRLDFEIIYDVNSDYNFEDAYFKILYTYKARVDDNYFIGSCTCTPYIEVLFLDKAIAEKFETEINNLIKQYKKLGLLE